MRTLVLPWWAKPGNWHYDAASCGSSEVNGRISLPILAATGTGIQVGAAIVATRFVVNQIDPVSLTFLRYLVGACCLIPIMLRMAHVSIQPHDVVAIGVIGLIQFGLLIVLLNMGLRTVPAAQGSLLFATSPLWALALGIVTGQELWSVRKVGGILVALAGLAVVLGPGVACFSGKTSPLDEALIVGAAACAAIASIWSRPYVRQYGALPVSGVAMVATVVVLALPSLLTGVVHEVAQHEFGRCGCGRVFRFGKWDWLCHVAVGIEVDQREHGDRLLDARSIDGVLGWCARVGGAIDAGDRWRNGRCRSRSLGDDSPSFPGRPMMAELVGQSIVAMVPNEHSRVPNERRSVPVARVGVC